MEGVVQGLRPGGESPLLPWVRQIANELAAARTAGFGGDDGVNAGYLFKFASSTSMADPGTGYFRLNNATLSSATAMAISDLCALTGNPDVSAAILAWDDSTNPVRGTLLIKQKANPALFRVYDITGASTDNSGWTQLALTHVAGNGSWTAEDELTIEFVRAGDVAAAATQAQQEAASSTTVFVTPGRQQYHPSACKAEVNFNGSGTVAIRRAYNVSSIADNGTGDYTVNFTTAFASADYSWAISAGRGAAGSGLRLIAQAPRAADPTTGAFRFLITDAAGTAQDAEFVAAIFFGDQ